MSNLELNQASDQMATDSAPTDKEDGVAQPGESSEGKTSEITLPMGSGNASGEGTEGEVMQLDPRWIRLERGLSLVTVTVLSCVALIILLAIFNALTSPWDLLLAAAWVLGTAAAVAAAILLPKLSYQHWSYQLGEQVIHVRHGIIWRVTMAIPLSRLQHVDLHRGPIERRCGLSTLEIHTAGTRAASHRIPGLGHHTAMALRDQLIDAANRGNDVVATD